jgi:hypothetical protein
MLETTGIKYVCNRDKDEKYCIKNNDGKTIIFKPWNENRENPHFWKQVKYVPNLQPKSLYYLMDNQVYCLTK